MLPTDITYSTLDDFKALTQVASQKEITEDDWLPAALYAEDILDGYIGFVSPFVVGQDRKFPTFATDGITSYIPNNISRAHIYITSWVLQNGEPSVAKDAKSESWSGTGYSVTYAEGQEKDTRDMLLPPLVLRLLAPYMSTGGRFTY